MEQRCCKAAAGEEDQQNQLREGKEVVQQGALRDPAGS
jgi:hypothetical protein